MFLAGVPSNMAEYRLHGRAAHAMEYPASRVSHASDSIFSNQQPATSNRPLTTNH
jgi:hypothetical protein